MLIMKAGQELTCENGHVIAVAARDIDSRDEMGKVRTISVADFTDWRISAPPEPCSPIEPCPHCGAVYIRRFGSSWRPHTPDGWAEDRPPAAPAQSWKLSGLFYEKGVHVAYLTTPVWWEFQRLCRAEAARITSRMVKDPAG